MSQYMREKLISAADSGDLDFRDSVMVRNAADAIAKLMWERDQLAKLLEAAGVDAKEIKAENAQLRKERDELAWRLRSARERIADMLKADDGQAWGEAERFMALEEKRIYYAEGEE